eukprot:NODE_1711_length_760_cov_126.657188_g1662_i0.p1 GENE.NODE_1711_length_760_cov_126.657188_g1662_i0~~NODE_1711_length_760_cov_126.657188_g1662_i0.p1  ORF type:complete len:208 (+),score=49.82 NODE_1711_length_760_cov_126.657188_g1662_i0:66-689(+)
MGLTRSRLHKKRVSGGQRRIHRKKRQAELARPAASTKLMSGKSRVRPVRCRGGALKFRALRVDTGNFAWVQEGVTRKARILDVVYNATSNELVRTKTLVKNCVVQIDAGPFRSWYYRRYGIYLGKKKKGAKATEIAKVKEVTEKRRRARAAKRKPLQGLEPGFRAGRVLAILTSRPGQVGRCDGRLLEGAELAFYQKKTEKKKKKAQ